MDLHNIQPNAVTVTAVFRALGRSGQLQKTQQLAEQMERLYNLYSWNMLRGFFVANDILLFAFFLGKSIFRG